jgi:predicted house-cleaning NTP pyrophosphatase (Maf/HAM1 superfamily)
MIFLKAAIALIREKIEQTFNQYFGIFMILIVLVVGTILISESRKEEKPKDEEEKILMLEKKNDSLMNVIKNLENGLDR